MYSHNLTVDLNDYTFTPLPRRVVRREPPSELQFSTRTISITLSGPPIDTEALYSTVPIRPNGVQVAVMRGMPPRCSKPSAKPPKRCFANQVTLRLADKINLMVFGNGRITVTGCKDDDDVERVKRTLAIILPHNSVADVTTYTINAHFDLGGPIDTSGLYELLGSDGAKFNHDTYSIELSDPESGVKCILFNTGSVSMFRAKSETTAHRAREYVIRLLQDQGMLASTYTVPDVPGLP